MYRTTLLASGAWILLMTGALPAQTTAAGLSASASSLTYSYQVNAATLPASQTVTVTATGASASSTLSVKVVSAPSGWLTVTPDTGRSPLSLSVSVNPTGLAPGSYAGLITVNTVPPGSNPATVSVTLSVKNPAPVLSISSAATNFKTPPPALTFSFTTGSVGAAPNSAIFNVLSSGDTIPFSVTAGASSGSSSGGSVWLRVNGSNQTPSLKTSGVALSGSSVPITVTIDPVTLASLNPGSYTNVITVAANNPTNGTSSISVSLVVAAGPPTVNSIFPLTVVAGQVVPPTITIYGDNFFSTSVVTMQQAGTNAPPAITLPSTLLSRKVLRAVVPVTQVATPGNFNIYVTNPAPPSNPSQAPANTGFAVISATQPAISAIVDAASYLPTATQTGTGADPVPGGGTSLSPRELITIFGQNLGPTPAVEGVPTSAVPNGPQVFPAAVNAVTVNFTIPGITQPVSAPLLMVSGNQINAVVPVEVGAVTANPAPGNVVTITVTNGVTTAPFNVTAVDGNPGVFSFDGLGKGQAAVLNFDDASGSYIINSSSTPASKSSTILIYATGLGDLSDPAIANGEVAGSAVKLFADTVRVDIDGQPAVVTYAGTTPGAVAGLVQLNAIVPPTVRTGAAIPLTVSVGSAVTARRSQALVTIAVK
jgi:uncharacterized protein (TIGR03437 family)